MSTTGVVIPHIILEHTYERKRFPENLALVTMQYSGCIGVRDLVVT